MSVASMIGHELRQVSLCSAAQAVLSTLSTGATRRASPGRSVQNGRPAPGRRRRTPRRCGRLASLAGDGQVARRRRGTPTRVRGHWQGQPSCQWRGRAGRRQPQCTATVPAGRGRCQPGWPRAAARTFFFGRRLIKGPAGPMAARFMPPRKRLAHVPWNGASSASPRPTQPESDSEPAPGPGKASQPGVAAAFNSPLIQERAARGPRARDADGSHWRH